MVDSLGTYAVEAWTKIKQVEPTWVSAAAAAFGAVLASGLVVRWYALRRDLRGSGAAILALLGESCHEALPGLRGSGQVGWIAHSNEIVYFMVGADRYVLCKRDLERLHELGYVFPKDHQYHLSRLGKLLLERPDNTRLLAKGVRRSKGTRYLRCNGGLWLRCRCEKYWVTGHERVRIPFPLGKWWTNRMWRSGPASPQ